MTALPEGTHLAYHVYHEAWYAQTPGTVERPSIGVQASHGTEGCAWHFMVEQHDFSGADTAIRVGVFHDAFPAFTQIPEFFASLAAGNVTTLQGVRELLDSMGAVDETSRVSPYVTQEGQ